MRIKSSFLFLYTYQTLYYMPFPSSNKPIKYFTLSEILDFIQVLLASQQTILP